MSTNLYSVGLLLNLPLVTIDPFHIVSAMEKEDRFHVSFWDALILSAASSSGAEVLYTEDLNHGDSAMVPSRCGILSPRSDGSRE